MVDARFSAIAAVITLAVAILSGADAAWAPALVFGLIGFGFAARALQGRRSAK